jgi:hypothetical protein
LKSTFLIHTKGTPRPIGFYFDPGAIVVGAADRPAFSANHIRKFSNRFINNRAAQGIDSIVLKSLPSAHDEKPPFLTFVATDKFRLPDETRNKLLYDYGVSHLVVRVDLVGDDFEVEALVSGKDAETLKSDFLSLGVATHLIEKFTELQPFVESLTVNTPEVSTHDGYSTLKIKAKWPTELLNTWLEELLGPAPKN